MGIEKIIEIIHQKSPDELKKLLLNSERSLSKDAYNNDALRLRGCVLEEWGMRFPQISDGWTSGTQGDPRTLKMRGNVIASVHRLETHKTNNKEVYRAIIKGQVAGGLFHRVEDARSFVENELTQS